MSWPSVLSSFFAAVNLGTTASIIVLLGFGVLCLCEIHARYKDRHLPPGISGFRSLFQIPNENQWSKMFEHNAKYGDIASISPFGLNIILVGSADIAEELLEKRSVNYSDRPRSVMAGELSGWGNSMLLSGYNEWFRNQRKWFAQEIGSYSCIAKLHNMIEFETRRYLRSVLDKPDSVQAHIRKNMTSIVLRISHGYTTQPGDDPLVELARVASSQLSMATAAGRFFVDYLPFLKYVPSWLPGAGFKRRAKEYAAVVRDSVEIPHSYAKSQLAAGTALPSLSSRLMNKPGLTEEEEYSIKWTTATMYIGGVDTSTSVTYAFYLAMTLNPRVMKRAQEELDSVVGTARLPTFSDRASLPYVEAVFTELLRWQNSGPLTVRRTRADDTYNGYLIPAGSYVFANIWAMLRDEREYKDPTEFIPERFLGDNPEPHPGNVCFGFGRRKCPGQFLVHSTIWLMCAQTLAVFDISKYIENGVEVTPEFKLVGATILHQAPFKCRIRPRSVEAEGLIREEFSLLEQDPTSPPGRA